ncbi:MAG TPA: Xaa-Pro peptidase family protein [Acidimicrobiales bacterium]
MTPLAGLSPLAAMDVAGRAPRLRKVFDEAGIEALLVTKLVNIRYLLGFTGSAGMVVVAADELVLVTDGRYRDQAAEQLAASGVAARILISDADQRELVSEVVRSAGVARLGLEADAVTWGEQRAFAETWFPTVELVPTSGLMEGLRLVKDDGEVARIGAAAAVADAALANVRHRLVDGLSEQEFGLALDTEIRALGATGTSFETIVGSGPNGAKPHHRPSTRRIERGDLVVLDFGAVVDGYCSDMTRTVMVGDPSPTQQRMLEVVTAAQQAGVDAVAAGVATRAVDAACRQVITDAGWGEAFLHATGHGVGLEIHEAPRVAATADATLAPGLVVTVEPGVYLPDHGGVRVEDTLVVTTGGCRALTLTPKTTAV